MLLVEKEENVKMKYQKPELELIILEAEDVITLSSGEWGDGNVEDLTGVNTSNLE